MLIQVFPHAFQGLSYINPDHIQRIDVGTGRAVIWLVGQQDEITLTREEWDRVRTALTGLAEASLPMPAPEFQASVLQSSRQHVTESDEERASRVRLEDLWQAKNDAHEAYQTARFDDYEACEAYAKAAAAYASAACGYIAGLKPCVLPEPIVQAVTAVEHARAREPFLEPLPALKDLYTVCRDALPTPRLMKRED